MDIELPYGHERLHINLKGVTTRLTVLEPPRSNVDPVRLALAAPMGSPRLAEIVRPRQKIVILTSDMTRPCPSHLLLPPLMDELAAAGIRDEDVTVVFGLGSHRAQTEQERRGLVGEAMAKRLQCIDSNPEQTVHIGTTRRGTPVEVFRPVAEADVRIVLGNVEPHYFAGYSGGAKALMPGVCSLKTIRANHAFMVDPQARTGNIDGNPVRQDIEEGAAMLGIDFMLNVVLDNQKNILAAAAGHPVIAHRWLCKVLDAVSLIRVAKPADILIVSAGGYPKDLNMYQAQKALDNAAVAVKPGGQIIWLAQCSEGLGHGTFEEWMVGSSPDLILERIQRDFVLGGHKAAAIARVLKQARILLVSDLPDDLVRSCCLEPYPNLDAALHAALAQAGPDPSIIAIPQGGSVMLKLD